MTDNGLMEQRMSLRYPKMRTLEAICAIPNDNNISLSLWDFVATFGILLFGYAASSILLFGEYFKRLIFQQVKAILRYLWSHGKYCRNGRGRQLRSTNIFFRSRREIGARMKPLRKSNW